MSACTSGTSSSDGSSLSYASLDVPESSIEIMEEDLLCPICFSPYEEPQILRCAHSFCKICLEGVIRNSAVIAATGLLRRSIIKCPVCRMETFVRGPNGPKNNFTLKGIVDKYKLLMAAPKITSCEVHAGQPLNMYCSTDGKLICGMCATSEEHQEHIFYSLDEAYTQEKIFLEQLIQELENRPSEQRNTLELARGLRSMSEPLRFLQKMEEVREKVSFKQQPPRSTVTDQSNPSHPQKTHCTPSTTSNSTWAWSAGVLLCTLMMAAFFTASFYGSDHIMSDHVTGEAVAPILAYWNLAVIEISDLGERCQDFIMWVLSRAAEYAHSIIWMRGKEKQILRLAWEKKDTPTPSIKKTTAKPDEKPEQTGQMRPTISSNTTEMANVTMSKSRDLQTTRSAERHLALHQRGLMLLSCVSKAIRRAAGRVSDYWWIIVKEIHHLGGRCHTYIQEIADRLYELV